MISLLIRSLKVTAYIYKLQFIANIPANFVLNIKNLFLDRKMYFAITDFFPKSWENFLAPVRVVNCKFYELKYLNDTTNGLAHLSLSIGYATHFALGKAYTLFCRFIRRIWSIRWIQWDNTKYATACVWLGKR